MPALSDNFLRGVLMHALPDAAVIGQQEHTKPVELSIPGFGMARIYLWTTTPDRSAQGRPAGEHKAQIILPGTLRGSRQTLNTTLMPTFLLGYSPSHGLFTAWEAVRHRDSGYSKNLQFREECLDQARESGWAADLRDTQSGKEVRAAFHPVHLAHFLSVVSQCDAERLEGLARLLRVLKSRPGCAPGYEGILENENGNDSGLARESILSRRLKRDADFARLVLPQYGSACALCGAQLNIIEGCHVIPVHHAKSRDELWNGIALCRNHHRLFDNGIIHINPEGFVFGNDEKFDVLRASNLAQGFEQYIHPHLNRRIKLPAFWDSDKACRRLFQSALAFMFPAP